MPSSSSACRTSTSGRRFLQLRKALSKPRTVVRPVARFLTYFGKLNREKGIALLNDMMARGPSNMQVYAKVAKKYHKELGSEELVKVFENAKVTEGLYYYLGVVVSFSEYPIVHFKYIQSACMLGLFKEAERVCPDSNIYNAIT